MTDATDVTGTPRAVPFYCPFCGEQTIRPAETEGWRCESCDRVFVLRLTSLGGTTSGGTT